MFDTVSRFQKDAAGATVVEYGLIAGLISAAFIAVLPGFSGTINTLFATISNAFANVH